MARFAPTVLVLVLLVATAAAFAVSERLKLEPYPVRNPKLTPRMFSPERMDAAISFRLRKAGTVSVWVVETGGTVVQRLADDEQAPGGTLRYVWNGRGRSGNVVPDGAYHVRVDVEGRTIDIPDTINVDTTPPRAAIVSVRPPALVRHRTRRVVVRYRLSEQGTPMLFVGRRRSLVGARTRRRGRLDWYATRDGRQLPPGRYRLTLRSRDEAGNVSPPSAPVVVSVER